MKMNFNFHSERARKARFMVGYSKGFRAFNAFLVAGLAMAGVWFWTIEPVAGAIQLSLSIVFLLPIIWYEYDIVKMDRMPLKGKGVKAEEVLSPDVVGRLRSVSNPYAVWAAIDGTWQQRFFSLRFGVDPSIFNTLSRDTAGMDAVWDDAAELSRRHGEVGISTAALMVALLRTKPDHIEVLADLGLDMDEVETSIDWLHHTERVISRLGKPKHAGGVARDWTSGYTPVLNRMAHNMSDSRHRPR